MDKIMKKLRNAVLHNLFSPNVIRMMKSRMMQMAMSCSMHRREQTCLQDFCKEAKRKEAVRKV
jgi:hypothetical protein